MFVPLHLPMITQRYPFLALCLALVLASVVACSNNGEEMRRQLNELQARNQADSVLNDTATAIALATYFDDNGMQNERLEAHYLLARTWTDLGQAPRALEEYQNAAALADTTNLDSLGNHWLSRIYGHMGELLFLHELPYNALHAYQNAYRYSEMAGEVHDAPCFYAAQSECYFDFSMPDSAAYIIESAINMFLLCGDTLSANTYMGPLSYLLVQNKEYSRAKECLEKYEFHSYLNAQTLLQSDDWKLLYVYKGFYYKGINQCDSALFYYNKSLYASENINNKVLTYRGLYQTYAMINQRDSVSKYAVLYGEACNESNKQSLSSALLSMHHLYDYNHYKTTAQQKTIEASNANLRLSVIILISTVLLAVLIVVLIYFWNHHKMFRLRLYNKYSTDILGYIATKEKLHRLENQYAVNEHLVMQAKEDLKLFRDSITQTQLQYGDINGWGMADYVQKSMIVTTLRTKSRKGQAATEQELQELRRTAGLYLPRFLEILQSLDYPLQKRDLSICILIKIKFSPSEICTLIQISSQALSNLRKRLLKRLFNVDGSSILFDEMIQELSDEDSL